MTGVEDIFEEAKPFNPSNEEKTESNKEVESEEHDATEKKVEVSAAEEEPLTTN
jgi:hypothetical protein